MRLISRVCKIVVFALLRFLGHVYPRNSRLVAIGAWQGKLYIDNPKYLLDYLLKETTYKVVWVGDEIIRRKLPNHNRLSFARKGSFVAFVALLRARTWICCQAIGMDLIGLPISGNACLVDLWHGIPIKKIGNKTPYAEKSYRVTNAGFLSELYSRLMRHPVAWLTISSDKMGDILAEGVPYRYSRDKVLRCGSPRNDFLVLNANNHELINALKVKYSKLLGFDKSRRIVLYLPTWRMNGDVFSFYNLAEADQIRFLRGLDSENAVLIEKHHFGTYERFPIAKESVCSYVVTKEMQDDVDVQEMLLIADVLISDYSGAFIDFGLLKRPCIHFAYDREEYATNDSGLAYELEDVAAGEIVDTRDRLFDSISRALSDGRFNPAGRYGDLVVYETGTACRQIVSHIDRYAVE